MKSCLLLLLCIISAVKATEIDFLKDLVEDSRKRLQTSYGEMFYCYNQARYSKTNGKLEVSTHARDHVIAETTTHSSFIISAEIKVKGTSTSGTFIPLSMRRKSDDKELLSWWLNAANKQVGIQYYGTTGPKSTTFFANVPFATGIWVRLTLRFRRFQRSKPVLELYVNDVKSGERIMSRNFRNAILKSNKDDLEITLAKWTRSAMPKVCMRRVKLYSHRNIEEVIGGCPESKIYKKDLLDLEKRITAGVTASYEQAISKMMTRMQSILNTCGVCKRTPALYTRPPPTAVGPKQITPVANTSKQVLKPLVPDDPCPPGLNACHPKATCTPNVLASGNYCKCNLGFAGNGYTCGKDSDLDGFPDEDLPNCKEKHCRKDNCVDKPNSGQDNADGDEFGDACDEDQDNDGILNKKDSCPLNYNPSQQDSDGDRIGDACDNCVNTRNRDQTDTDKNGKGDACTVDIDADGVIENDNCPKIKNSDQKDTDKDGVGDACDNCPKHRNSGQEDVDQDLVGDECDSNIDRDKDGINDDLDNCVGVINPGQLDTDMDGMGDECDPDDDNDGVLDKDDNCRLTANKDQKVDPISSEYGLACKDDFDGDSIANNLDSCPENRDYSSVSFYEYQTINLDPKEEEQVDPVWKVLDEGREILQVENSDPGMAIGKQSFRGVDYYGTIYVDTDQDNDYFGLIFGFQSSSKFYTVMWKKVGQTYWDEEPFRAHGKTGLSIKVVDSVTGPGPKLRNALWSTDSTKNQVRTLWHDSNEIGWLERTAYHWELRHRPKTGYIRFKISDGEKTVIDTGVLHDKTYSGGRIGVMSFSQEKVSWSKIFYRCSDGSVRRV